MKTKITNQTPLKSYLVISFFLSSLALMPGPLNATSEKTEIKRLSSEGLILTKGNSNNVNELSLSARYFLGQSYLKAKIHSLPGLSFFIASSPKAINQNDSNHIAFSGSYNYSKKQNRSLNLELKAELNEERKSGQVRSLQRFSVLRNEVYCNSKDCLDFFIVSVGFGLSKVKELEKKLDLGGIELALSSAYKIMGSKYFQWSFESIYNSRAQTEFYFNKNREASRWIFLTGPKLNLSSLSINAPLSFLPFRKSKKFTYFLSLNLRI